MEQAEIVALDEQWNKIEGTEKIIDVDTICIATGLTPLTELAWLAGCEYSYIASMGGHIPVHNKYLETSVDGLFIAGDISGIEEASTAMEEGKLAGISACYKLGLIDSSEREVRSSRVWARMDALRCGPFGLKRKEAKAKMLSLWEAIG